MMTASADGPRIHDETAGAGDAALVLVQPGGALPRA